MLPKKVKFNALPSAPMVGSLLEKLNIPLTDAVACEASVPSTYIFNPFAFVVPSNVAITLCH